MSKEIKVLHVEFKKTKEHQYFGCLKAIFDTNLDIGITKGMLYKHNFSNIFENEKVIIRQGMLIRSPKNS